MVSLLSIKTLDPSPKSYFPSDQLLTCTSAWDYSSPGIGPFSCLNWISGSASLPFFPAHQDTSEWQQSSLGYETIPLNFVSLLNLLRRHSIPSSKVHWIQYWPLGDTTVWKPPTSLCGTDYQCSWVTCWTVNPWSYAIKIWSMLKFFSMCLAAGFVACIPSQKSLCVDPKFNT